MKETETICGYTLDEALEILKTVSAQSLASDDNPSASTILNELGYEYPLYEYWEYDGQEELELEYNKDFNGYGDWCQFCLDKAEESRCHGINTINLLKW